MRRLLYGMNLSLDGYIAAPGDDLSWSGPSDELFQWWLDQERAISLLLYGRKLWETMSAYWPTGDQQPGATPAQIEFARNWRDTPKVVFSSTVDKVDWNTRLVTGDAVAGDHSAQGRGRWADEGRWRSARRGGDAGRADRRVRDRHTSGPGG